MNDNPVVQKQLPIDESSKAALVKARLSIFDDEVSKLASSVYTGDISIGEWEESMRRLIREVHSSVSAINKGGWGEMTYQDWGRLGPLVKEQYKYLHTFAEHISTNKDTVSLEYITSRSQLYGKAAIHSAYYTGSDIARMLPYLPKDGSTECLVGCKCTWELEVTERFKDHKIVKAVWTLHPAEHCNKCVSRRGHTELLRVPLDMDVPVRIGGLE